MKLFYSITKIAVLHLFHGSKYSDSGLCAGNNPSWLCVRIYKVLSLILTSETQLHFEYCRIIMKKIKRFLLLALPYSVSILSAYIFYILGNKFNSDIKGLMHGIAGSFLSIPILYLIYELSKRFSERKLNTKLFDHAKMQIDQDVLSIINQLMKLVRQYENVKLSPKDVQIFLSLSKKDISKNLKTNKFIGFQVFKMWEITEQNINKVLGNSFILNHLDNEQLISLVDLLDQVRLFDIIPKRIQDLYIPTNEEVKGYKIESGVNLNKKNTNYPERYVLLKYIQHNEYKVTDFGDFPLYQKKNLLNVYQVNEKYIEKFSTSIFTLISALKLWIELTNYEFIIDPKMFKSN